MSASFRKGSETQLRSNEPPDWEVVNDWNQDGDMARRESRYPDAIVFGPRAEECAAWETAEP